MLNEKEVDPDEQLMTLGVSSLNIVEIMLIVELIYGDNFDPEQLSVDGYSTLRELDEQLLGLIRNGEKD